MDAVSKSFSIDALLAPSANDKPETETAERACVDESPARRDDDATSTYQDDCRMSPRSYVSTGSSMADRPASATSDTAACSSSSELGDVISGHHVTSGLQVDSRAGLIQSLHRGMLDVMRSRGPPGLPPGIILSLIHI